MGKPFCSTTAASGISTGNGIFDWFYRTPSHGTGGEYSFDGTFESAQPLCK